MNIPPVVADLLRVAAPTLATALGGPLGGLAAALATEALRQWLPASSGASGDPAAPPLSPIVVTDVIRRNSDNPEFIRDLQRVEADLQKYEMEVGFRFADLAAKDRQSSRDFQRETVIARPLMYWGMGIVVTTVVSLLSIVAGSLMLIAGIVRIPYDQAQLAVGVFGLIGTVTGYLAGYGSQVLSFYFGSSNGEKAQGQQTVDALRDVGAALGEAAKTVPAPPPVPPAPPVVIMPPGPSTAPDRPAVPGDDPSWRQGPYGGARWRVTQDGILLEGEATPERTIGEPVTVRRIWASYGPIIRRVAQELAVPAEIVVAVIATESRGQANAALREPDGRVSGGVMQVLTGTASEVLGRPVTLEELSDPSLSIAAGVGYIAKQRSLTGFDPILVAAAYNAGGLYKPRPEDKNRYKLRSTGDHLDRMRKWFNDTVWVAREDGWFA